MLAALRSVFFPEAARHGVRIVGGFGPSFLCSSLPRVGLDGTCHGSVEELISIGQPENRGLSLIGVERPLHAV